MSIFIVSSQNDTKSLIDFYSEKYLIAFLFPFVSRLQIAMPNENPTLITGTRE